MSLYLEEFEIEDGDVVVDFGASTGLFTLEAAKKASKVSKAVKDAAKSMGEKEVDKYASTKHKGLPNKKERIEAILRENPIAIAATQGALKAMKKAKVPFNASRIRVKNASSL